MQLGATLAPLERDMEDLSRGESVMPGVKRMKRLLKIIALFLPIAGAGLSWGYLRSFSHDDARRVDLAISALRMNVLTDRRVEIALTVANRGTGISPNASLFVNSLAVEHAVQLAPLRSGEQRVWTWVSSPLQPGDYELVAGVDPGGAPDADESNNVARGLLHVASASAARVSGPSSHMPWVVGLTRHSAIQALGAAGLAEPVWYERARGSTIDRVDLQWPEPGTRIPRGANAVLLAAAARSVPDLQSLPLDQARERLRRIGLVVGPLRIERSVRFQHRSVLDQEPKAGSRLFVASPVSLVVSEPQPLWPFAISGLLCLFSLMLVLSARARGTHARPGEVAWSTAMRGALPSGRLAPRLPERSVVRLPDWGIVGAADASLELRAECAEALDDPLTTTESLAPDAAEFPASVPEAERSIATIEPPAIRRPLDQRITVAPESPANVPEPRTSTVRPKATSTIGEIEFIPVRGEDCQEVTWQSESSPTTLVVLIIRDPGDRQVTWYPLERSET